jgi:transcriptional regulator with XRE-family HTH domain
MEPTAIRRLRTRHGWTQAELAARLGTDAVTVSRWERGVSSPRRSAVVRLKELAGALPREAGGIARALGRREVRLVLERVRLLRSPRRRVRFAVDPGERLREVDRSVREQRALRERLG